MPNFRRGPKVRLKCRLKEYRQRAGYTKAVDYAEHIGVTAPELSKWENNKLVPSLETAMLIASDLKCSVHDLFVVETMRAPGAKKKKR